MTEQNIINIPGKEDKVAFDALFKSYYAKLTAYACLFVESQVAEDIVQDLFLFSWENGKSVKIHTSIESYLFKSVYQRCLNYIKQYQLHNFHHKKIEDYLLKFEKQLFDPDANESIRNLYMAELNGEINKAIADLPEKCRQVFLLSYIHNLKNKEISETLGVSLSTVENHIYNALKILRQKLKKHALVISILFPL